MLNITLLSLVSLSNYAVSPLYSINKFYHLKPLTSIHNSIFSYSFTPFIYGQTNNHGTIIKNTVFSHSLDSGLSFNSEYKDQCYLNKDVTLEQPSSDKYYQVFKNIYLNLSKYGNEVDRRPKFYEENSISCGDITIIGCRFDDLYSSGNFHSFGGALHIEQDCNLLVHETVFNACHTLTKYGGAIFACKKFHEMAGLNMQNEKMKSVDIQFCCFQHCYGKHEYTYGIASLISANITRLYYSSTINCTYHESDDKNKAYGAQFDIQAENVTSNHINATGSYSIYCGSVEYRDADTGHFQFQTIVQMDCKFAISFTSVLIDDLKISNCNVVNNSIRNNIGQSGIVPALIHVRLKPIIIQDFYFANNKFLSNNYGSFASRGNTNDDKSVIITLENCYSDDNDSSRVNSEYITTNFCDFNDNEIKTAHISQLFLGECYGEKMPDPFILSSVFTPSNIFTLSSVFSKSDAFTNSEKFSNSGFFSPSSNLVVNDKDSSVDDKKGLGTGPMVGIIAAAVAAVAAIVGLIAFFIWKKKHIIQFSSDPNLIDTGENSVTVDNNLRSMMDKDDPFADEFQK